MNKSVHFFSFLVTGLVFFLQSCGDDKAKPAGAAQGTPVKDYPVITITPRTTALFSEYPASIEGQQNIEIRPKIDGYVEKIYVDEGATVKKGTFTGGCKFISRIGRR